MIIKLDHISYVASLQEKDEVLSGYANNTLLFKEMNKRNLEVKMQMMHEPQKFHDLYFYKGKLPIEVIFYEKVFKGEQVYVEIEKRSIHAKSNGLPRCEKMLKSIGVNEIIQVGNCIKCNLRGAFDKEDCWLIIKNEDSIGDTYLDDEGFGCITFLVNDIGKIKEQYEAGGGDSDLFTEQELVVVNGRRLKICFLRSSVINVIFEFITPVK